MVKNNKIKLKKNPLNASYVSAHVGAIPLKRLQTEDVPVNIHRSEVRRPLCYCNKRGWERSQPGVDTHHLRLRVIHYRQQDVFSFRFFSSAETNRISWPDFFFFLFSSLNPKDACSQT